MTAEEYTIPPWMEPYLDLLGGRDEIVRLLSEGRPHARGNVPLTLPQCAIESAIMLLHELHKRGMLLLPPTEDTQKKEDPA